MNELSETAKSEITRLHSEILEAARTSVDKAIRIGELLTQEKDKLDHGQWLPWLKANVPFTRATAANYMRCWERREELKCKTVLHLGEAYRILAPSAEFDIDSPDFEIPVADPVEFNACHKLVTSQLDSIKERLNAIAKNAPEGVLEEIRAIGKRAKQIELLYHKAEIDCLRQLGEIERAQQSTATNETDKPNHENTTEND